MLIKELNLIGFRNYIQESIKFESNKVILIGKNAQGKTNLLEVIQVLSVGKSKRASRDRDMVNWDLDNAVVHLAAERNNDPVNISLQIRKSGRRTVKVNEVSKKPSELAGNIYSVSFMVDDLELVYGSPSKRRDWIDAVLIQLSRAYREDLSKYDKALSQRNSYLKNLLENGYYHANLNKSHKEQLQIWDDLLLDTANAVIQKRLELLSKLAPLAASYYAKIAGKTGTAEELEIKYIGSLLSQEDLDDSLAKDFARGYTNVGPHRQDIEFNLDGHLAGSFASQGQRRTIVLALKLAELELLQAEYNDSPILLLDDVLAELDEDRQDFLLDAVKDDTQVVITTTHLGKHLEKWQANAQVMTVKSGSLSLGAASEEVCYS